MYIPQPRRDFLKLLCGAVAAAFLSSPAHSQTPFRISFTGKLIATEWDWSALLNAEMKMYSVDGQIAFPQYNSEGVKSDVLVSWPFVEVGEYLYLCYCHHESSSGMSHPNGDHFTAREWVTAFENRSKAAMTHALKQGHPAKPALGPHILGCEPGGLTYMTTRWACKDGRCQEKLNPFFAPNNCWNPKCRAVYLEWHGRLVEFGRS